MHRETDPKITELAHGWLRAIRSGHRDDADEQFGWNEALDAMGSSDISAFYVMMAIAEQSDNSDELASVEPWISQFVSKFGGQYSAEIAMEFDLNPQFATFVLDWAEQSLRRIEFPNVLLEVVLDALNRRNS